MKLNRSKPFPAEVSTSSLNDIMFFLLLFFLIVSTFSNPNVIKVLLPNSDSGQSINKQQIDITITADKKYFIGKEEVAYKQLESELANKAKLAENPTVVLRFAHNLDIQDLVDVLEVGNHLGLRMMLATKK